MSIDWSRVTRLHIGCGTHRLPDPWCNTDAVACSGSDAVLDVHHDLTRIPSDALSWVYWSHGPEHCFPDLLPGVFRELRRCLRPGGKLDVVTIDINGIYHNRYIAGLSSASWNAALYGEASSKDHPGLAHRQCFNYQMLQSELLAAGFQSAAPFDLRSYPELWALNDYGRSCANVSVFVEAT